MIIKPEFKGVRKKCKRCGDLWPHYDIKDGICGTCADALRVEENAMTEARGEDSSAGKNTEEAPG